MNAPKIFAKKEHILTSFHAQRVFEKWWAENMKPIYYHRGHLFRGTMNDLVNGTWHGKESNDTHVFYMTQPQPIEKEVEVTDKQHLHNEIINMVGVSDDLKNILIDIVDLFGKPLGGEDGN